MQRRRNYSGAGALRPVRLPKEFRMDGEEVRIRKQGAAVVLEPVATDWAWLDAIEGKFSRDFFAEGANSGASGPPALNAAFE